LPAHILGQPDKQRATWIIVAVHSLESQKYPPRVSNPVNSDELQDFIMTTVEFGNFVGEIDW
jgi:hypothetical protein